MKQSEKVLLGVLCVVCLVAGYLVLFEEDATKAKVAEVTVQFEKFASELRSKVDEKALTLAEEHTLAMLVEQTTDSPFYYNNQPFYFEEDEEQNIQVNDILYSGYLRFGDRVFAIINNIEYAVGDEVVETGMRVVSINREFVSLEREDPNTERISRRKIPLVEDDMEPITLRSARQ